MDDLKYVDSMGAYTDLFLAYYSLEQADEEGIISFSNKFYDIMNDIMNNLNMTKVTKFDFLYKDGKFDIDSFMVRLKSSQIRYAWADPFIFDLKENKIKTQVYLNKLNSEIDKYEVYDREDVKSDVEKYINKQEEIINNKKLILK